MLYYNEILFGGIYDNAIPMYLVDTDNKEIIKDIILETYKDLIK